MPEIADKVSLLESGLSYVKAELASVKTNLEYILSAIDNMVKKNSTNWGVLAGWAAVIITVSTYLSELRQRPTDIYIEHTKAQIKALQEEDLRHQLWREEEIVKLAIAETIIEIHNEKLESHDYLFERIEGRVNEQQKTNLEVPRSETANPGS